MELEDVFPLPLDRVWELLHAHLDEGRLSEIHPQVLRGRSVREKGSVEYMGRAFPQEKVAERVYRIAGRSVNTTWTYRIEPPDRYAYDLAFPNGSTIRFENRYAPAGEGTRVRTTVDLALRRVPAFIARWIVRRSFDRSDREDLAYARQRMRP